MERLGGFDAWLLYSETSTAHQHTIKILVLKPTEEHPFDLEHLRRRFERRLHLLLPFCYQLAEVPFGLHHPMWLQNCKVDLDHHIRQAELPAPGGRRELEAAISEIASSQLQRSRPLWELHALTGLEGGRVVLVTKMHHALADGMASANLLARAVEYVSDEAIAEHESPEADHVPGRWEIVRLAMLDHAHQLRELPALLARTVRGVRRLRAHAPTPPPGSARVLKPVRIFLNGALSDRRRYAVVCLPLGEILAIKRSLDVTLNDVVLGLAAGMMRRLLLEVEGRADDPLVASVAISTDTDPTRLSGNRLSGLLVSLPVQLTDPVERCRSASASARVAKEQHRLLGRALLEDWLAYLPPRPFAWYAHFAARRRRADRTPPRMNLVISNVPGPREPIYSAGYPVESFWSVGPLWEGCGLNVTVWSYGDQLNVSVLADPQRLPDIDLVTDGFRREFVDLRASVETITAQSSAGPPTRG